MSQDAQKTLHVLEKNVDYAGKNFYGNHQYINTVYVTVPESAMKDGKATIRFGIMVGDNRNDKTPVTTGEGEWTVFDDFRILYAANKVNEDLILDENRDNLSYLVNCKIRWRTRLCILKEIHAEQVELVHPAGEPQQDAGFGDVWR